MLKVIFFGIILIILSGCSAEDSSSTGTPVISDNSYIYYGDIKNNEIVKIDFKNMKLVSYQKSSGIYPYEIANGFDNELLILNRDDTNIGILKDDVIESQYTLSFKPRSISLNRDKKTILLSSSSEAAMALLPQNNIYSDSEYKTPISFGGSGATGHPIWVNENYFLLLDRTENSIELYNTNSSEIVAKLFTSSSVHHLKYHNGFYYGTLEGIKDKSSPGIIKFKIAYEKFESVQESLVSDFNDIADDFKSSSWGFHHFAFHPDGEHIYSGSYEGNVFVFDVESLSIVDSFKSGRGVGHFTFFNNTLITTNHYDNFKSFYDASNPLKNTLIKELKFSQNRVDGIIMQSHTTHIIDKNLYFTYNTDEYSRFYKISLDDYTIVDFVELPQRYCVMGTPPSTINQYTSSM